MLNNNRQKYKTTTCQFTALLPVPNIKMIHRNILTVSITVTRCSVDLFSRLWFSQSRHHYSRQCNHFNVTKITDNWRAPWKNRTSSTSTKLRKSLVKPVTWQNI